MLLAAPFLSSAATVSDLQAQISSLLSQIQALRSQSSAPVSGTATASSAISSCPSLSRSLSIGSRGSDVAALQQFLSVQGYLSVSATGYFGTLTKAAVGRWQAQNGITGSGGGFGIFGPLSRSYLFKNCSGTAQSQQNFSADPQSGAAPLSVAFTTSDSIVSTPSYSVDFGDGATGMMMKGSCIAITAIVGGQGGIRCSYSVSHTYASTGTYTAQLIKDACGGNTQCESPSQIVGTTRITVGSVTSASFSASPISGTAPLTVQFTSTAPQGSDIGRTVDFGDGSSGSLAFVPICSSCNAIGIVSHTYASAGSYTATLTGGACACPANGTCNCPNIPILGMATITVPAGSTASNPTIEQLNAPGSVSLPSGGIGEIRNENFYFTLESLSSTAATIQITPVGCWNSFPSDAAPHVICMIAMVPIPPQTLSVGQSYSTANYRITLTQIANSTATFSVSASSATQ